VRGKVSGLMEKPAPVKLTEETTRSAPPVLVTVTVWLLDVPTVTLAKFTLLGETLTDGVPGLGPGSGVDAPVLPHPLTRNGNTQRNTNGSKKDHSRVTRFGTFTSLLSMHAKPGKV